MRSGRISFLAAFTFTLVACAGLLGRRLAQGDLSGAWPWSVGVMFAAVIVAVSSRVFGPRIAAHALGAALAIGLVHFTLLLRPGAFGGALVEDPRQLVNDGVLVAAILALVWSFDARGALARVALPAAALAVVTLYDLTAPSWHLDAFAGTGVQHYVSAQVVAVAAGLFVFDLLRRAHGRPA